MSFPRYPRYKDSGVEWLGEVPEHWALMPIKRDLDYLTSGSRGWAENYADDGDLFIRIANLTRDGVDLDLSDVQRVVVGTDAEGSRTRVAVGDVLFSITAYLGSVAVAPDAIPTAYVSQHVALARFRGTRLLPRWVAYAALSVAGRTWFDRRSYGGTKIQLSLDDVRELPIPVPSLAEQRAICAFLDREVASIAQLVAEQERLIELLREKRQAVISHAVTKGLDPNVPMKDSGVEWLGEVPVHWEPTVLRRVVLTLESGTSVNAVDMPAGPGVPGVLKTSCVYSGSFDPTENKAVVQEERDQVACPVRPGCLIVSRMNTPDLVGAAGYVGSPCDNIFLPDRLWQVSFRGADGRFIHHWTLTSVYRAQVQAACTGTSASMKNLSQDQFGGFALAMPPLAEQHGIVAYLDGATARIDTLITESHRAITLLQERRAALITAAVTGQIDVRGLVNGGAG